MERFESKKIRPVFIWVFFLWHIYYQAYSEGFPYIHLAIFIAAIVFRFKEEITITSEHLEVSLRDNSVKIDKSTIDEIIPFDCWNKIRVKSEKADISLNIGRLHSRKVERFFTGSSLAHAVSNN